MPVLAALAISLLFLGSASAILNVTFPNCTVSSLNWTFNSLNQNPCQITAYLTTTCLNDTVSVPPLPHGFSYFGPEAGSVEAGDVCQCNTVTYSLMSACGVCQGAPSWTSWGDWSKNCISILPPSTFPHPVPNGTGVPQWALQDVSHDSANSWDEILARTIGDTPEIGPGVLINGSISSTTSSSGTIAPSTTGFPASSSSSPASSPSGGGGSNTGAIVGGVVGGVAIIAIALIGTFYLRSRRPTAPSAAFIIDGPSRPYDEPRKPLSGRTLTSSSTHGTPMKAYNPNGPTTFPARPGA